MLVYNAALRLVKEGKLDRSRVDRGLGLALSRRFRETHNGYKCTDYMCNCIDASQRWVTCKHQIAIAFLKVAREVERGSGNKDAVGTGLPDPVQQRRKRSPVPDTGGELPSGNKRRPRSRSAKGPKTRKGMEEVSS
jgi:hypothetical protein